MDYIIQKETLQDLAEKARGLSGTTESVYIRDMLATMQEVIDEVDTQATLLEDATEALVGKTQCTPTGTIEITENGTHDVSKYATANVNVAGGGGVSAPAVPMKDVNFYDYDGTRLYSYTVAEAQALTEMPPLPTRAGLTCQGWNYDLDTIKAYNRAVDVGATYITDDGKTRLYITIAAEGRMDVPLYISQTVANGVTIDWGDGSATETLTGTGRVNTTHTYASVGDYVISLDVAYGCTLGSGSGNSSYCTMGMTSTKGTVYRNMLRRVEIGNGVTSIGAYMFCACYSLVSVAIPNGVTSIEQGAFNGCYSLASVVIPNGVTSIGAGLLMECHSLASVVIPNSVTSFATNSFNKCYSLASVVIPNGVTSIADGMFNNCYSLASVVIPNGVTSIGGSAFYYCQGMAFYDFTSHASVPTLSHTNAFSSIPSDCKIRVPAALYDEWIATTNWANYASNIVAV